MNIENLRIELSRQFVLARSKNARYSKRAFAQRLSISHGALIEILNGKRKVSRVLAERICDRLSLSPKKRQEIFALPETDFVDTSVEIQEDQFQVIAEGAHLAILSLLRIPKLTHDISVFAKLLGISEREVRESLVRLERLQLIRKTGARYERTKASIKTSDEIASLAIRLAHRRRFEAAIEALETVPVERRDFTSLTMAINSKKLAQAKKLVRQFQLKMENLLEDENPDSVYVLNIQLLPITNGEMK